MLFIEEIHYFEEVVLLLYQTMFPDKLDAHLVNLSRKWTQSQSMGRSNQWAGV